MLFRCIGSAAAQPASPTGRNGIRACHRWLQMSQRPISFPCGSDATLPLHMQAAVELGDSRAIYDTCNAIKKDFSKALEMKSNPADQMARGEKRLRPGSYYWAKKVQCIRHALKLCSCCDSGPFCNFSI